MRPFPVLVLSLFTLLLGAPFPAMAQSANPAASSPSAVNGDFAGLVDIGAAAGSGWSAAARAARRSSWSRATATRPRCGTRSPSPRPGSDQTAVLPGVATFTRVCAYDRPGTLLPPDRRSRSDPVPMPRTAADAVDDLHALLSAAGVPGPYVLVGHSLGGIIVRLYAATYPDEVVGLVLVDASHEDQNIRFQAALGAENWTAFESLQRAPSGPDDDPALERMDLDASFAQLQTAAAAHPLPPLPLIVLTHGIPAGSRLYRAYLLKEGLRHVFSVKGEEGKQALDQ